MCTVHVSKPQAIQFQAKKVTTEHLTGLICNGMILLAFSTLLRTELTVEQFNTASPKVVSNSVANKTDKCVCAESGSCYHPSSFAALLNRL